MQVCLCVCVQRCTYRAVYAEVCVQGFIYVCIDCAYMQGACVYIEICVYIGKCVYVRAHVQNMYTCSNLYARNMHLYTGTYRSIYVGSVYGVRACVQVHCAIMCVCVSVSKGAPEVCLHV